MVRLPLRDAHRDDGKRFVVRADEKLSTAKTLQGEKAPSWSHTAASELLAAVPDPGHVAGVFLHIYHRIVFYDNEFTVKW